MSRVPLPLGFAFLVLACHPEPPQIHPLAPPPSLPTAAPSASHPPPVASSSAQPQPEPPAVIPLDHGASVTLRPRGSALIELTLERGQLPQNAAVEVERRAEGVGEVRNDRFPEGTDRLLHTTTLGPAYVYRARAGADWSEEVLVRVSEPNAAPPPPTLLDVQAVSPYVAHVTWQADESLVAGIELEVKKGADFVRIALANPFDRKFALHGRVPGQSYAFRIRAFNAKGASLPTEPVTLTMPTSAEPTELPPLGRCEAGIPKAPKGSPGCNPEVAEWDQGEGRVLYSAPSRGNGCRRRLIGMYQGCLREFGAFELQADVIPVSSWSDEGWPLLLGVAGAGEYVGGQVWTLRFFEGRYLNVDETRYCGERWPEADELHVGVHEEEDPTKCTPPFEACQSDYPT